MTSAPSRRGRTGALLPAVALLSGAAALVFETLWYRTSGLVFGNGVWG